MSLNEFLFNPFQFAQTMARIQLETVQEAQTMMMRQLDTLSKQGLPISVDWSDTKLPMPSFKVELDETRMREAFHLMADANLMAWSRAAELTQSMPSWTKWAHRAPGEFWTGVFDKFSFTDLTMPANDAKPAAPAKPEAAATEAVKTATKKAKAATKTKPAAKAKAASPTPELLKKPNGKADDLTQIKGVGPKLASVLHDLGVFHFTQIAAWTPENCAWIDDKLAFKGRVQREAWVDQARQFVKDAAAA